MDARPGSNKVEITLSIRADEGTDVSAIVREIFGNSAIAGQKRSREDSLPEYEQQQSSRTRIEPSAQYNNDRPYYTMQQPITTSTVATPIAPWPQYHYGNHPYYTAPPAPAPASAPAPAPVDSDDDDDDAISIGSSIDYDLHESSSPSSEIDSEDMFQDDQFQQYVEEVVENNIISAKDAKMIMTQYGYNSCMASPGMKVWDEDCPICYTGFSEKKRFSRTPCGHTFHYMCLKKSIRHNRDCPMCRADLDPQKIIS